jgi:Tfp pilus assembly protein PilN
VRAVNLIPGEHRSGGAGGASAAYVVLGVLGLLVIAVAVLVLTGNTVKSRRSELARVTAHAAGTEQRAAALQPYIRFASLRQTRVATVNSLALSRFDWERAMTELSKALPGDVWLTSLLGTVAPGITIDNGAGAGGAGATSALRSAVQSPAIELVGCTSTQSEVSRVMARLHLLHGVTRVSLAQSEKNDTSTTSTGASGAGGGSGASTDCRNGTQRYPQFQIVVFFENPGGAAGGALAGATTPGAAPGAAPSTPTSAPSPSSANGAGK